MMSELQQHIHRIRQMVCGDYHGMYREEGDALQYPFLTPGSAQYDDVLWDWDSWWSNVALRQILAEVNDPAEYEKARPYERGCILNWIHVSRRSNHRGWVPISCARGGPRPPKAVYNDNMHKPCLAQHAAFLVREDGGDAAWLREGFYPIQCFLNDYRNHHRDRWSGLYYWQNDNAIGVDDDPCTFGRPPRTSASIYLNCLMVKELEAAVYLCQRLNLDEVAVEFQEDRDQLADAVNRHCWDEWLGFYYSVDLSRYEQGKTDDWGSHCGYPRDWPGLIQRINVWSGFLGSSAVSIAQARRRRTRKRAILALSLATPCGYWTEGCATVPPVAMGTVGGLRRMQGIFSALCAENICSPGDYRLLSPHAEQGP